MLINSNYYKSIFWILFAVSSVLGASPAKAVTKVTPECIAGSCADIGLRYYAEDTVKNFPDSKTRIRFDVNPSALLDATNSNETYRAVVHEIDSNDNVNVLASTTVRYPFTERFRNRQPFNIRFYPFIGSKDLYISMYKNNGELSGTYRFPYSAQGSVESLHDLRTGTALDLSCPDQEYNECNVDKFLFSNVIFESFTRFKSVQTFVIKEPNDIYRVLLPITPHTNRELLSFKKLRIKTEISGSLSSVTNNIENPTIDDSVTVGTGPNSANVVYAGNEDQLTIAVNGNDPVLVAKSTGNIGINNDNPDSVVTIESEDSQKPQLRLDRASLISSLENGAFEYDGSNLYFTKGGQRFFILLSETDPSLVTPGSNVVDALNSQKLGGQLPSYYLNAANVNAGTLDPSLLPDNFDPTRLRSVDGDDDSNNDTYLELSGNQVELTSTADVTLELPNTGTLVTSGELIEDDSVTTNEIVNFTIQSADIADNTLQPEKIPNGSIDAGKFTTATVNESLLPSRSIANINTLQVSLDTKSLNSDIVDNLTSTAIDRPLSANQGSVLKGLVDNFGVDTLTTTRASFSPKFSDSELNLSFASQHSVYTINLLNNLKLNFTNLSQGHRMIIDVPVSSGNRVQLPTYGRILKGSYNAAANNRIKVEVIDPSAPLVFIKINQY